MWFLTSKDGRGHLVVIEGEIVCHLVFFNMWWFL